MNQFFLNSSSKIQNILELRHVLNGNELHSWSDFFSNNHLKKMYQDFSLKILSLQVQASGKRKWGSISKKSEAVVICRKYWSPILSFFLFSSNFLLKKRLNYTEDHQIARNFQLKKWYGKRSLWHLFWCIGKDPEFSLDRAKKSLLNQISIIQNQRFYWKKIFVLSKKPFVWLKFMS